MAIYSFPISENKEEIGNIVALEAYTTDQSYNNNRKLVFDDGCIDIVSVRYLDEKYPNLSIGKVKSSLTFKSKGSGITAKNSKLYTEINTLKRKAGEAETIVTKPNYDENISKFANYFTDSKHIVHDPVSGKYAGIAHKQIEDDNFYLYKNFSVIWSDKEGKIINHLDFSKQYLKKVNQFIPVYDEFTNVKGVFLNLNHQPSFKKAYKDPVENNFHVLYADFDGNVMLNKDIQYGNPENSRCFNPMVAIKTDGKLKFLNRNQDKLLNSFLEVVQLDLNGEIKSLGEVKSVNIDIFHIEEFNFRRVGDKNIIISSVARMESATSTSTTTQVANQPKYSDLVINVFDMAKMQIVSSQSHKMDFNEIKDLKVIEDSNGQVVLIVPTDVTQTLVSIDKGNVIKIENPLFNPRSKSYAPLDLQISVFDNANYIVDKNKRTIHFVKSSNQNASHAFFYFSHKY